MLATEVVVQVLVALVVLLALLLQAPVVLVVLVVHVLSRFLAPLPAVVKTWAGGAGSVHHLWKRRKSLACFDCCCCRVRCPSEQT